MVQLADTQGAPQVRRRTAHEPEGRQGRLPAARQGRAAEHQGLHHSRDPEDPGDLRDSRLDAVQAHHQLDGGPGLPQDGRRDTRHFLQLPFLRPSLPAERRQRQLAGSLRLRRAVLRLLQQEEQRKGGLLRRLRVMELLPRHAPALQHEDPLHRAGVFRHSAGRRRQGVRQPAHIHDPEHNARIQLLPALRQIRGRGHT